MRISIAKRKVRTDNIYINPLIERFTMTLRELSIIQSPNWLGISSVPSDRYSSGVEARSKHPINDVYSSSHIIEPLSISSFDYEGERNSIHCMATCNIIESHIERKALGFRRLN